MRNSRRGVLLYYCLSSLSRGTSCFVCPLDPRSSLIVGHYRAGGQRHSPTGSGVELPEIQSQGRVWAQKSEALIKLPRTGTRASTAAGRVFTPLALECPGECCYCSSSPVQQLVRDTGPHHHKHIERTRVAYKQDASLSHNTQQKHYR